MTVKRKFPVHVYVMQFAQSWLVYNTLAS